MRAKTRFPRIHRSISLVAAARLGLVAAISLAVIGAAGAAGALGATETGSAPQSSLSLATGSRLWLEGQSTLHAYSSTATKVDATAEIDAAGAADARAAVAAGGLKNLRVTVPVAGLKSGENGLDKNLQKTLKPEAAPVIRFTLVDYKADEAKDGSLLVKAHGKLAIAGVEKDTTIDATCRFGPGGVEVTGAKDVLMSDFGIKPPTMMLGSIKTADKVVVRFTLKLKAPDAAPAKKS